MAIYMWREATPITTAGIYRNEELGLISLSSDGTNRITIADKNLGATTVYNDGDTVSSANYGNFYQWGNNYGFAYSTGGYTPSSTSTVNASTYGPGNYYSNSTRRTVSSWDSSNNANLRGNTTNTNSARQGPCTSGFHIPSRTEGNSLISISNSLGLSDLYIYKAAYTFYKSYNMGNGYSNGELTLLSTPSGDGTFYYISSGSKAIYSVGKGNGLPIRPFKNEAVQPRVGWTKLN